MKRLRFIDILEVPSEIQENVRVWRNHPEISRFMYTDSEITKENHAAWLKKLVSDSANRYFVVYDEDRAIGVVYLNRIDTENKTTEWGFYLSPLLESSGGKGALIEFELIEYVFNTMGFEQLTCAVLASNTPVIKLHGKFGFKETEVKKGFIVKAGEPVDVVFFELTREAWEEVSPKLQKILFRKSDG